MKLDEIPYYPLDKKQIIAFCIAIGIILTGAIAVSIITTKNDTETTSSAVTENVADNSITCIIEDVGTVQDIDTKPDSRIIVDSDGKSNIVYSGSSQKVSQNYYVYL